MVVPDAVAVAVITGVCGIIAGAVGARRLDKKHSGQHAVNGNGQSAMSRALAERDETRFQERMTLLVTNLIDALKDANKESAKQFAQVSEAITETVETLREVHQDIIAHREASKPVMTAALETHAMVTQIHREVIIQQRGKGT